jgi:hypothetical protein
MKKLNEDVRTYETNRLLAALNSEREARVQTEKMHRICVEILSTYGIEAIRTFNQKLYGIHNL